MHTSSLPRATICKLLTASLVIIYLFSTKLYGQTLRLKFGFEDSGTTTADSVAAASLNLVNSGGTATDLHGIAGSGVAGVGHALDLSFAGVHGGSGGGSASTANSTAVNFGAITNFTMTLWLKPNTNLNGNPRFFFLGTGTNGTADINTTNTVGIQGNQSGSSTSAQTFIHAFNNVMNGLAYSMPSNQWSFLAFTYDGLTLSVYNASETNAIATAVTAFRTNLVVNVGGSFRMYLGNNSARTRSFNGLMDDVRFYTSAGDAAFLENVRVSALTDPFVISTTITPPIVAPGGSVLLSANAYGTAPISYQWLFTDTNGASSLVPGATSKTLNLSNVQFANAGTYSLIVSNNPGGSPSVRTNIGATLTVRVPNNIAWIGSGGTLWDTTTINWDIDGDHVADTNYVAGDYVRFDDFGMASTVSVESALTPSGIVVSNTLADYSLTSSGAGSLTGIGTLQKQGSSRLIIDVDNNLTGGTLIDGGVLQVGGDTITGRGSLGTGNVTNNSGLVFSHSGAVTVSGVISGPGGLTNNTFGQNTVGNLILSGANKYSGVTEVNGATLTLANSSSLGNSPLVNVTSTTGGGNNGTRVSVSGGISIPPTTISLSSTFDTARSALYSIGSTGQTNQWNGPIILNGNGNIALTGGGGTYWVIAGEVSGPTYDGSLGGSLQLRGVPGLLSGTVNLPIGNVLVTDNVLWNIHPSIAGGNNWSNTIIASGTMQCGTNNAIPPISGILFGQSGGSGTLDLAGFNQTLRGLLVATNATAANQRITNSSVTSDSTLTYSGGTSSFGGIVSDGVQKLNLTIAAGNLTMTNAAGISLSNSTVAIASGAVLELDYAATNIVASLILNGVSQPSGVYNSTTASPFIAGTGSLQIPSPIPSNPTNMTFSVSGNSLALAWPASYQGWVLQSQTNNLNVGIQTNSSAWFDWPGSASITSTNLPIDSANGSVFFRLRHP